MPTGYTEKVLHGQSFEAFVMTCASSFLDLDPRTREGDVTSEGRLAALGEEAKTLFALHDKLTAAEREQGAEASYQKNLASWQATHDQWTRDNALYAAMEEKVHAWVPPVGLRNRDTKLFLRLKSFMLEQLGCSHEDLDFHMLAKPQRRAADDWWVFEGDQLRAAVDHYESSVRHLEERRTNETYWLSLLTSSLGQK